MVMYCVDYDDLPPSCRFFSLTYHGLEYLHNIQLRYHPRLNFLSEEELEVDINSRNLVPCIGALIQRTRSLLFQLRMRYHPRLNFLSEEEVKVELNSSGLKEFKLFGILKLMVSADLKDLKNRISESRLRTRVLHL